MPNENSSQTFCGLKLYMLDEPKTAPKPKPPVTAQCPAVPSTGQPVCHPSRVVEKA